ncbi:MAG TPA: GNAT family N-acetyltransferase [Candidatus Dormibacteraeota bacterium]|jgi:GNAT superfamily N-acetyltransferase
MALVIDAVAEATPDLVAALAALLPQLNPALLGPSIEELAIVLADHATTLVVASEGGVIVAVATLIVYSTPIWVKARIEGLTVDEPARGRGIGEALVKRCVDIARQRGARVVELQSAERREVAHRLFVNMGFERRDSHVYRLTLS